MLRAALLTGLAVAGACRAATTVSAPAGPYVLVLGTAQDGGLPQIGCSCSSCTTARGDPARRRRVSALLVADPRTGRRWLLDASPDLPEQVESARGQPATRRALGPGAPLFEGIFLTHAHVGHYAGLLHLGREAYGARGLCVYASDRMAGFLRDNGPWSLLVDTGAIEIQRLAPGEPVELAADLTLTPTRVPHRDEFSDTLAFVVRGPRRTLLYLPDIDQWERWERPLEQVLAEVDVALLDGTFFDGGELPGRDLSGIPHPFVAGTIERLRAAPADLRARVLFTHLNHSNPLADPASEQCARLRREGMGVAQDGQILEL